MAAPLIPLSSSLDFILDENSFTLGELQSHPLAAAFTPQFDAFQATWFSTFQARAALQITLGKAEGAVSAADDVLDDLIDILDRTLLIAVKNDRKAPAYQFFFGQKPPSLLKRPILGEQLATVKGWVPSLQTSPYPAVAALAPTFITAISTADKAVADHTAAEQALKDFDMIGGKKTLADSFNALRQTVFGELAAIPHQNPAAMLPATFADRFFRHALNKGITAIKNPKEVQAKIDALQNKLTAAQNHLSDLTNDAKKQADAKAQEQKDLAAIDQAKADEEAARQKRMDLEKQAKADKKKIKKP